jgi:hypothetical protein
LHQETGLGAAFQVHRAVGGEDAIEQIQMRRHGLRHGFIGGGDQVDRPALAARAARQVQHVVVVDQAGGVQVLGLRDPLLEPGAAFREQHGQ